MAAAFAPCSGTSSSAVAPTRAAFGQPPLSGLVNATPLQQLRSRSTLREPPADDMVEVCGRRAPLLLDAAAAMAGLRGGSRRHALQTRPLPPTPTLNPAKGIWYLPDAVDALAEPAPVRLRSVHSKQASVIRFSNKSARAVRALWVDFDGHELHWGHGRAVVHAWGCFVHG
jgi:hypothetical protein